MPLSLAPILVWSEDINMRWTVGLVGLVAFFSFVNSQNPSSVTVTTKDNKQIIGFSFAPNTLTGLSYDAFLGVPYGQLQGRFKAAVPANWTSPLTAQADGPACPQPFAPYKEDCLYLNVFTPKGASSGPTKFPVMAFIHGSAFTASSSNSIIYGPDLLVNEGVILVTFNYRLGAAGFLTLGSNVAPGNLGLTDSRLALQWIQDEIAAFGGDPAQVTLFGQSAGSAMVTAHYLSPLSAGLFKYAIAQSGSTLSDWALISMEEGARRAKVLAQAVGCSISVSDSDLLACLQKAPIEAIVGNQSISLDSVDMISGSGGLRFVPVFDFNLAGSTPFFNDTLEGLKAAAIVRGKPLMTGITTDDGSVKFAIDDSWKQGESNLQDFIPRRARQVATDYEKIVWANSIKARYFPDTYDEDKVLNLLRLNTDTLFAYPAAKMSMYFANLTYGYVFQYYGSWAVPRIFMSSNSLSKLKIVNHGAEIPYLFYITNISLPLDNCTLNAANLAVQKKMVTWWTTFAKTGVPDSTWPKASTGYKVIDATDSSMTASTFNSTYYEFWAAMENHGFAASAHFVLNLLAVFAVLTQFYF